MEISIIIPVYNVEPYLRECLDSILLQTFRDYEIICINDCSTDNSLLILEEYQEKYGKIQIINNVQNKGLSYSRNIGMKKARGKYLLFVDSDDYLASYALEVMYKNAEAQQTDILYFNKRIVYEDEWNGEKDIEYTNCKEYQGVYTGKELFLKFTEDRMHKSMNAYTQFFKKEFLRRNSLAFYEGVIHEDYLFYFLCAMSAKRVANINEQLYVYRKRENSITANISQFNVQSMFIAFIEVYNYWKNHYFTETENKVIKLYVDGIYQHYKNCYRKAQYHGSLRLGSLADQYLFECLNEDKEGVFFSGEELEQISCAPNVWVYGAGKIGHETAIVLNRNNIWVNGYIVSDKSENQRKILGWDIYQLEELELTDKTLFIIAVGGERARLEIRDKLEERGFHNILFAVKS